MVNKNEKNGGKALVVTSVASTLDQFCMNDIALLQKTHKVYVAANFSIGNNTSKERVKEFKLELMKKNIIINEINFSRNPLSKINFLAYKDIKKVINSTTFEVIHCHTPIAAMMLRLVARKARKKGTKVIYTAHGFHFFKGAPLRNWLIYYPIERWLSRYTDMIITINKEDYERAKKLLKAGRVEYIPGVGINARKFSEVAVDRLAKRRELGIPDDAFVVLSVGELNKNKNHETIIRAISKINNLNVYYVICGQGILESYLKDLINKLGLDKQVKLLGYYRDIAEINKASDVFAFPSKREGLGVAALEAMASGLPLITSNVHGIPDYAIDGVTSYCYSPMDIDGFADGIKRLAYDGNLRATMGKNNATAVKKFDINTVNELMKSIYENI